MIWALVFAVLVPLGAGFLFPKQYESSTDVAVFPGTDDGSASSTYQLQPDRFVATQIAVISSRAAAEQVARKLKMSTTDVESAVVVTQVEKSDVIRVTATDPDAALSAQIASSLASNYVDAVRADAADRFKSALASVDEQLKGLNAQIDALNNQIKGLGGQTSGSGPLQNQLNNLVSQQVALTSQRDKLLVDEKTLPANTRIVSNAAVSSDPVGIGRLTLAIYGAAFGAGLGAMVIAIRTAPGRTLEDLDSLDHIDGIAVLGVTEPKGLWGLHRVSRSRTNTRQMRGLRIASEIQTVIDKDGPVILIPLGRVSRMIEATSELGELVKLAQGVGTAVPGNRSTVSGFGWFEELAEGLYRVDSIEAFLQNEVPKDRRLILAVDVVKVSTNDLVDTSATLTSLGSDVVGIIGIG